MTQEEIYRIKTKVVSAGSLKQLEEHVNETLKNLRGQFKDIKVIPSTEIMIIYLA